MLKSWKVEKQIGRRAERWKSGNGGRTDRKRADMLKSWIRGRAERGKS